MKKRTQINIRVTPETLETLKKVAKVQQIPAAQLVREAVKEKISELLQKQKSTQQLVA